MPKKKQRSKQNGRELDSITLSMESDESYPGLPRRPTLQTSKYYKLVLKKRRTYLINNLDLESHVILLDHLVENDVITKDQYDHIKDKKGRERVAKLLDALSMKDTQAFFAFLNLLRETGDDFIADELIDLCQRNNLSIPVEMKPSHIQNHQQSMHTSTSTSTEFSSSYFVSSQESGGPIHETVRRRHPKADMQNPSTRADFPPSHVHIPEPFSSPTGYHKPPDIVDDFVTCQHGRALAICFYCVPDQSFLTRGLRMINDNRSVNSCGDFKGIKKSDQYSWIRPF
ncbi:uncharacterized protein LOC106158972 [Lingula anatina]|uniref:Uncharacterized protein LOC106158972 n=1 Tax=Lingula anatina TaxID=7574 RepID=A0A1S3HX00_LINAN|nr:uncharacterized protein LOC106158972 [Lingula anatina]|eukprot:XP_013390560.1 uncharacterized protein LOC106158972 [Lingula anatina]